MNDNAEILIAEITDFEIHLADEAFTTSDVGSGALSASMEVKIDEDYYVFGGPDLFLSVPNNETPDLVGHFILRCFQTVGVRTTREFEGELIKIRLSEGKVVGISSLRNDDFFNMLTEFTQLRNQI